VQVRFERPRGRGCRDIAFKQPAPFAVEERCQAIAEAAQEIVEAFMQDFQIRLKTGIPKQARADASRALLAPPPLGAAAGETCASSGTA
jgi:hypothetical protein